MCESIEREREGETRIDGKQKVWPIHCSVFVFMVYSLIPCICANCGEVKLDKNQIIFIALIYFFNVFFLLCRGPVNAGQVQGITECHTFFIYFYFGCGASYFVKSSIIVIMLTFDCHIHIVHMNGFVCV